MTSKENDEIEDDNNSDFEEMLAGGEDQKGYSTQELTEEELQKLFYDIIVDVLPELTDHQVKFVIETLNRLGGTRDDLYELIALIKEYGYPNCVKTFPEFNTLLDLMFNNPSMKDAKKAYAIEKELIAGKSYRTTEGIPCPLCTCTNTRIVSKQVRASDEPMTDFGQCLSILCGYKWRSN